MPEVIPYGREVVVRKRFWFGSLHCQVFEVCDASAGEPYAPIAAFYSVDDVWRYIVAEGHRVRNWKSWLLTTVDVYRLCREMDEHFASWSKLGENLQSGDV